jgi:anthranilate phosphoribosyltransferase
VVLNAALALVAAELADDVREGLALAAEAIDTGTAAERLERLAAYSREGGE